MAKSTRGNASDFDQTVDSAKETNQEAADHASAAAEDVQAEEAPDLIDQAEEIVSEAAALAEARAEAADWKDKYLRLHAEWDTYRRRTQEQRSAEKVRATEKLMEDLLPILDDFERTIAYAQENGETGLTDGVIAVNNKLNNALEKHGLQVINPVGEAYDALEAQAVATVPDEEQYDETVAQVYQKGYKMGTKVLRAAMVTVTMGGPKRPKDDELAADADADAADADAAAAADASAAQAGEQDAEA